MGHESQKTRRVNWLPALTCALNWVLLATILAQEVGGGVAALPGALLGQVPPLYSERRAEKKDAANNMANVGLSQMGDGWGLVQGQGVE